MLKRARIIFSFLALTVMVGCVGTSEGRTAGISVSPSSATAGTPSETITISGTDFAPTSTILVNGSPRATNYISGTKLSTALTSTDLARPSVLSISVASSSSWSVTPLKTRSGTRQKTTTEQGTFMVLSSSLQILTSSLPAGVVQAPYSASLAARGGVAPTAWKVTAGQLPAGINLVASTGALSGTPTQAGTASFSVGITDSSSPPQTATQLLTLGASAVAAPLSINFSAFPGGITQTSYASTASATGGMTPYAWSVASGSLPSGLSLNASSGVIAGTPTTTGTFNFGLQVKDSSSTAQTANVTASILIVAPLKITTTSLPAPQLQKSYSVTLATSGGMAPYVWSVASGALPTGLSLNSSTGIISGTPTTAGTYAFTLSVNDPPSLPQNASQSFSATVSAALTPLQITTTNLPSGQVKTAYNATFVASGGTIPYTWAVTSGALPTPLALSASTGQISGTPTTAGAFNLTVQVKDSAGQSSSANFAINIASQPTLSIVTASLPGGTVGASYAGTLQATGGTQPYNWSIASGQLPGGLVLNASSGVLSGTPTVNGSFPFTVQVADASSQGASLRFTANIAAAPAQSAHSNYTSRTDTNAAPETVPALCSPAPCTMTSSDLNANLVYTRVTDPNSVSGYSNPFTVNGEDTQKEWNSNTTAFYVGRSDGVDIFYKFNSANPGNPTLVSCTFSGPECLNGALGTLGIFVNANVAFSTVSPYVAYGLGGSTIVKMDFSATVSNPATPPTITTVANMASCPGLPGSSTTSEFEMNGVNDTNFVVPTNGAGQNSWTVIYTYDTTKGCRWLDLSQMKTGGDWGTTGNAAMYDELGSNLCSGNGCGSVGGNSYLCAQIHNAPIDEDGRWAHIETECSTGSSNLDPHWDAFWDVATQNVYRLGDSGGGVGPYYGGGHSALGFDNIYLNDDQDYGGHCFVYRTIPPTGANNAFLQATNCGALGDGHYSMANQTKGNTEPAIVTLYNSTVSGAWIDEILGLTYNGSGIVYRFAHTYDVINSSDVFGTAPFAHVSRDGNWALFQSNWGTSRNDTFVVPLR